MESPCQREGRGFESRRPLHETSHPEAGRPRPGRNGPRHTGGGHTTGPAEPGVRSAVHLTAGLQNAVLHIRVAFHRGLRPYSGSPPCGRHGNSLTYQKVSVSPASMRLGTPGNAPDRLPGSRGARSRTGNPQPLAMCRGGSPKRLTQAPLASCQPSRHQSCSTRRARRATPRRPLCRAVFSCSQRHARERGHLEDGRR